MQLAGSLKLFVKDEQRESAQWTIEGLGSNLQSNQNSFIQSRLSVKRGGYVLALLPTGFGKSESVT